jgi:hypothetical protein
MSVPVMYGWTLQLKAYWPGAGAVKDRSAWQPPSHGFVNTSSERLKAML